ncbi:hypothetical protein AMTRI_Chr01g130470 [Amborella trichopoda]
MGGCFLALLKFTSRSAQYNFPKYATKEDCHRGDVLQQNKTQFSTRSCRPSLWIGLLLGSQKVALMTNFAVLPRTPVRGSEITNHKTKERKRVTVRQKRIVREKYGSCYF